MVLRATVTLGEYGVDTTISADNEDEILALKDGNGNPLYQRGEIVYSPDPSVTKHEEILHGRESKWQSEEQLGELSTRDGAKQENAQNYAMQEVERLRGLGADVTLRDSGGLDSGLDINFAGTQEPVRDIVAREIKPIWKQDLPEFGETRLGDEHNHLVSDGYLSQEELNGIAPKLTNQEVNQLRYREGLVNRASQDGKIDDKEKTDLKELGKFNDAQISDIVSNLRDRGVSSVSDQSNTSVANIPTNQVVQNRGTELA